MRILAVLFAVAVFVLVGADDPTFLVFKYQHPVGIETDHCDPSPAGPSCTAHFELRFTGSSIALDARIRTTPSFEPLEYTAHGQNSTRSFIDVHVTPAPAPAGPFFTLQEDVPFLAQELLLKYWNRHGRPEQITLLPEGRVRIRLRGTTRLDGPAGDTLSRHTVHGVTWGNETIWTNARQEVAAIVGADAEEDRVEVVRPAYESALKQFVNEAAADGVEDSKAAERAVAPVAAGTFALTHLTLIEPDNDAPLCRDVTIVVAGGRIAAIGSHAAIPRHARVIDAAGAFVMPGLWDTHAHFEQWEWGPAYLAAGITRVRDVGNEIEWLVPLRRALESGTALGPRMRAAGLIDSDPGSLTSEHAEDADRARAIVQRYHDLGYEQIKIYQSLRPALIPVVTAEAHRLGMTVTGHIPTGTDALTAVQAGMDQINHIGFVTRVMRPAGATAVTADSAEARAAIALLLEHHTVVEPTLARGEFNGHPRRQPFAAFDPAAALLPPELAVILNNAGVSAEREARAAASLQVALDTARVLHDAGVPLLAGSDQVVPGFSIHRELELLVRAGLTPLEALRTATSVPGKVFGVPDTGVVRAGDRADLVVLDANPLEDISNIRRVRFTVLGGRLYDPAALRHAVDMR